jgi:serine protease AprX
MKRRHALLFYCSCVTFGLAGQEKLDRHFELTSSGDHHVIDEIVIPVVSSPAKRGNGLAEQSPSDPRLRISPFLRRDVERDPGALIEVLITFRETVRIPTLPRDLADEPSASPLNRANRMRREQIVNDVLRQRELINAPRQTALASRYGVELLEVFWLTDVWRARMPASAVDALGRERDVQHVESASSQTPPPATALQGRQRMQSDWLAYSPNMTIYPFSSVKIAILDTGVRSTHVMFNNPSNIGIWRDCVNGTSANCASGSNLNPGEDAGIDHGTKTAGIISGNAARGESYRGFSRCTVDSYKIYSSGALHPLAAVRAFSAATAEGAWVIAAEMQSQETFTGAIAAAADAATDSGAVVVAATGNNTQVMQLGSPANAHKVLGVGGEYALTGGTITEQLSGPTTDGRIKPDIQAVSYMDTASSNSNTALGTHSGTSGATAAAAAAAGLLAKWWCDAPTQCGIGTLPSPRGGFTYAAMIAYGSEPYPFNSTRGAGALRLMQSYGWERFGYVTVQNGQTIDVLQNIYARTGYVPNNFDVALWWPETANQTHSRVDLRLLDPSGVERASSLHSTSVFQRVTVPGSIAYGNWKVRITGTSIGAAPQLVFYWARVRGGA